MENSKSGMVKDSCKGCRWYLGGGCCRINAEAECREGGGFELYEQEEEDVQPSTKVLFLVLYGAVSALWGIVLYKLYCWIF